MKKTLIALLLASSQTANADWTYFDDNIVVPPLNTPNMWARGVGPVKNCSDCTGNILALIWDTKSLGEESLYPWPLYVQLTTDQKGGDATPVNARLYQHQTKGWGAVIHAEGFAQGTGSTLIGHNAEMYSSSSNRVIGFNAHMKNGRGDVAYNVMGDAGPTWKTGVALNGTGIDFGGGRLIKLDDKGRICVFKNSIKKKCLTGPL